MQTWYIAYYVLVGFFYVDDQVRSVGSEWTINALSFTQACGRAPNVMSRQPHWYSNLDWEPTQSREPAL